MTYFQYVTELTYLLFLKMSDERGPEQVRVPEGYRWPDIKQAEGVRRSLRAVVRSNRRSYRAGGARNRISRAMAAARKNNPVKASPTMIAA